MLKNKEIIVPGDLEKNSRSLPRGITDLTYPKLPVILFMLILKSKLKIQFKTRIARVQHTLIM